MRLPDSYLRGIVYLGFPHAGSETAIDPEGTGFLLVHENTSYICTAAHVATRLMGAPFGIRLNRVDNGLGGIDHIDNAEWFFHTDEKVDVALLPYTPPNWADAFHTKSRTIASDFKVKSKDFGPGDMAYVVGIFQKARGKEKNLPVVHAGNIASMARGEKMRTDDWRAGAKSGDCLEIDGYIVQVPTLPESSGSPVYVRRTLPIDGIAEKDEKTGKFYEVRAGVYGSVWLLGLWHGTWETEEQNVILGTNMGVCIPAPRILEALEHPRLKHMRQATILNERALKPQSGSVGKTVAKNLQRKVGKKSVNN